MPREQDVPGVVVALNTQRLPYSGVGMFVDSVAPQWFSVWAPLITTHLLVVPTFAPRTAMYSTKAGRGERHEHLRANGYLRRDVMAASGGPGGDELPGVAGVRV